MSDTGPIYEVYQSTVNDMDDMVAYCENCKTVYMLVPAGEPMFHEKSSMCSCSWNCCSHARPSNERHFGHMAYRPATRLELKTVLTYCRACLGAYPVVSCKYCHGTGNVTVYGHRQWVKDGRHNAYSR
jgi:hypothetical protein